MFIMFTPLFLSRASCWLLQQGPSLTCDRNVRISRNLLCPSSYTAFPLECILLTFPTRHLRVALSLACAHNIIWLRNIIASIPWVLHMRWKLRFSFVLEASCGCWKLFENGQFSLLVEQWVITSDWPVNKDENSNSNNFSTSECYLMRDSTHKQFLNCELLMWWCNNHLKWDEILLLLEPCYTHLQLVLNLHHKYDTHLAPWHEYFCQAKLQGGLEGNRLSMEVPILRSTINLTTHLWLNKS